LNTKDTATEPNQFRPDPARKLSANMYEIYYSCCVQLKTPDDGQRNCSKHIEFYTKNKFEKLVPLVGFITSTSRSTYPMERTLCYHLYLRLQNSYLGLCHTSEVQELRAITKPIVHKVYCVNW